MVEFRSALASRLALRSVPASEGTGVSLGESRIYALGQIAGWADFEAAAAPALVQLGFVGVGDYQTVQNGRDCEMYRTAPDRVLIRHSDRRVLKDALAKVDPAIGATLDLSHSRCCMTLRGPAVEDVLSRVATLDFHISAFAPGTFAQTGIHHVAVLIHRKAADLFDVITPVTWAASTFDYLGDNAQSSGLVIGMGAP